MEGRRRFARRSLKERVHLISITSQWSKQHFLPPHPGPLPQGEGARFPALALTASARFFSAPEMALPLPEGEGRGEGEVRIGRQRVVVLTIAPESSTYQKQIAKI